MSFIICSNLFSSSRARGLTSLGNIIFKLSINSCCGIFWFSLVPSSLISLTISDGVGNCPIPVGGESRSVPVKAPAEINLALCCLIFPNSNPFSKKYL